LILSIVPIIIIDAYFYHKSKSALINRTLDQLTTVRIEKNNRLKDFFNQRVTYIENLKNFVVSEQIFTFCDSLNTCPGFKLDKLKQNVRLNVGKTNPYNRIIFISERKKIEYLDLKNNFELKTFNRESVEYNSLIDAISNVDYKNNPVIYDNKNDFSSKYHSILMIDKVYENNIYLGTIVLEISLKAINNIMYENNPHNGLGNTGETYIVGEDYYMRSTSRFSDNSIFKIKVKTKGVLKAFKGESGTNLISDYRNIPVLSSFGKVDIPQLNWVVLAEIDEKEAMIPIKLIINDIIFMSIILGGLLMGMVVAFSAKITAPVKKLKQATDKISEGEYGELVNVKSNDEIGDLIDAFNKMITQLKEQSVKLEKERLLRSKSMLDGQEIERQRLSRELHDSLGQSILALKIKFEQLREASESKRIVIITEAENLFLKIMTEIRNISNDLMPAVLTQFGLLQAIKKLVREFSANTKIVIDLETNITNDDFDKKIEVYIYRIIQEALNNVSKHANADVVNLKINIKQNNIELSIVDNGKGFVFNKENAIKGNGISNIKERVNLLEGEIVYKSELGEGTSIFCKIPIK